MKQGSVFFLCILLAIIFVIPAAVFADEATENLVSVVVESFDPEDRTSDWLVTGSKFVTVITSYSIHYTKLYDC